MTIKALKSFARSMWKYIHRNDMTVLASLLFGCVVIMNLISLNFFDTFLLALAWILLLTILNYDV
jgi:hypothetical protein